MSYFRTYQYNNFNEPLIEDYNDKNQYINLSKTVQSQRQFINSGKLSQTDTFFLSKTTFQFQPKNQRFLWKELMQINSNYIRASNNLAPLEPYIQNLTLSAINIDEYDSIPPEYILQIITLLQIIVEYFQFTQIKLEENNNDLQIKISELISINNDNESIYKEIEKLKREIKEKDFMILNYQSVIRNGNYGNNSASIKISSNNNNNKDDKNSLIDGDSLIDNNEASEDNNSKRQSFYCQFCSGKRFISEQYLEEHMKRRHLDKMKTLMNNNKGNLQHSKYELLDGKLIQMKEYFEKIIFENQQKEDYNRLNNKIDNLENTLIKQNNASLIYNNSLGQTGKTSTNLNLGSAFQSDNVLLSTLKQNLDKTNEMCNKVNEMKVNIDNFKIGIEGEIKNLNVHSSSNYNEKNFLKKGSSSSFNNNNYRYNDINNGNLKSKYNETTNEKIVIRKNNNNSNQFETNIFSKNDNRNMRSINNEIQVKESFGFPNNNSLKVSKNQEFMEEKSFTNIEYNINKQKINSNEKIIQLKALNDKFINEQRKIDEENDDKKNMELFFNRFTERDNNINGSIESYIKPTIPWNRQLTDYQCKPLADDLKDDFAYEISKERSFNSKNFGNKPKDELIKFINNAYLRSEGDCKNKYFNNYYNDINKLCSLKQEKRYFEDLSDYINSDKNIKKQLNDLDVRNYKYFQEKYFNKTTSKGNFPDENFNYDVDLDYNDYCENQKNYKKDSVNGNFGTNFEGKFNNFNKNLFGNFNNINNNISDNDDDGGIAGGLNLKSNLVELNINENKSLNIDNNNDDKIGGNISLQSPTLNIQKGNNSKKKSIKKSIGGVLDFDLQLNNEDSIDKVSEGNKKEKPKENNKGEDSNEFSY